jgi:hypothetical protein
MPTGEARSESVLQQCAQTNAGSLGDRGAAISSLGGTLPIAGASELGVTIDQTEHMPLYLRTLFQVLSGWGAPAAEHHLTACEPFLPVRRIRGLASSRATPLLALPFRTTTSPSLR